MKPHKNVSQSSRDTLTVTQAAKVAGVSVSTIRRWIDDGFLTAARTPEGWRIVQHHHLMEALSRNSHARSAQPPTSRAEASHEAPTMRVLEEALERERQNVERERRINDELREQLKRFENEIFKLTAEMQALLSKDSPTGMLSRWVKSKIA